MKNPVSMRKENAPGESRTHGPRIRNVDSHVLSVFTSFSDLAKSTISTVFSPDVSSRNLMSC